MENFRGEAARKGCVSDGSNRKKDIRDKMTRREWDGARICGTETVAALGPLPTSE